MTASAWASLLSLPPYHRRAPARRTPLRPPPRLVRYPGRVPSEIRSSALSAGGVLPALLDAGGLAAQVAEVVELGAADAATGDRLDPVDRGAVHRERALHADAVAHLADGEGLPQAAALAADHDTLENLDAGAVAFRHLHVHLQGVTGAEIRDVSPELGLLKLGDRGVHDGCFLSPGRNTRQRASGWKPALARETPRQGQRPKGQRSSVCHIFGVNRKTNVSEHLAIPLAEAFRRRR